MFEILLVVVIIGIASGVAMPYFAQSMKGARLRVSARMVLSSHRHAQCQAILRQREHALLFDTREGTLEMVSVEGAGEEDPFFGTVGGGGGGEGASRNAMGSGLRLGGGLDIGAGRENRSEAGGGAAAKSESVRRLEEGVKFESFRGGKEVDGLHYVVFHPNGMCSPYTVSLADGDGRRTVIEVDGVTGKGKVKDR